MGAHVPDISSLQRIKEFKTFSTAANPEYRAGSQVRNIACERFD